MTVTRAPRRSRRRIWFAVAAVAVLLIAVTAVIRARSSAAPAYRTATAVTGEVKVAIDVTGTVQPVDRADLTFPVAGSVSSVPVALGQHVSAGEALAQLDTTALDAQVASATSTLAGARAKLAADRSGPSGPAQQPTSTSGAAFDAAPAAPITSAASGEPPAGSGDPGGSAVAQAQQAVQQAAAALEKARAGRAAHQQAVDSALAAVQHDLDAAAATCGPAPSGNATGAAFVVPAAGGGQGSGRATTTEPTPTPEPTPGGGSAVPRTPTDPAAPPPAAKKTAPAPKPTPPPNSAGCQQALQKVLRDELGVAALQKQLAADDEGLGAGIAGLVQAATKLVAATSSIPVPGGSSQPGGSQAGGSQAGGSPPREGQQPGGAQAGAGRPGATAPGTATAPQAGRGAAGGTARAATPVSPEQLAADQAAVDAAAAQLTTAQQNRAQATMTSPIEGVVGAINLQTGQRVTGGGTAQVVVIGTGGGYEVQASVGEGDVAGVAVGDKVAVTPDGATGPIDGTVSMIGLLPASSTGAVSYPVTIALPAGAGPFPAGQGAAVEIQLADVSGVLTVPTSAVHTNGPARTVDVLRDGVPQAVPVQLGAVGAARTEIRSGLAAGDVVVVADPSQPLPTAGVNSLRGVGAGGAAPRRGG